MTHRVLAIGVLVAAVSSLSVATRGAEPLRSISIAAFSANSLAGVAADRSLADVRDLGADAVAINVSWYQDDDQSTEIGPEDSGSNPEPECLLDVK